MAKTIIVEVTRRVPHPLYKRIVNKRKKFYAHDEDGKAQMGDVVRIIECRPLSKLKPWQLKDIVRKAVQVTTDLTARLASQRSPNSAPPLKKKQPKRKAPAGRF